MARAIDDARCRRSIILFDHEKLHLIVDGTGGRSKIGSGPQGFTAHSKRRRELVEFGSDRAWDPHGSDKHTYHVIEEKAAIVSDPLVRPSRPEYAADPPSCRRGFANRRGDLVELGPKPWRFLRTERDQEVSGGVGMRARHKDVIAGNAATFLNSFLDACYVAVAQKDQVGRDDCDARRTVFQDDRFGPEIVMLSTNSDGFSCSVCHREWNPARWCNAGSCGTDS